MGLESGFRVKQCPRHGPTSDSPSCLVLPISSNQPKFNSSLLPFQDRTQLLPREDMAPQDTVSSLLMCCLSAQYLTGHVPWSSTFYPEWVSHFLILNVIIHQESAIISKPHLISYAASHQSVIPTSSITRNLTNIKLLFSIYSTHDSHNPYHECFKNIFTDPSLSSHLKNP